MGEDVLSEREIEGFEACRIRELEYDHRVQFVPVRTYSEGASQKYFRQAERASNRTPAVTFTAGAGFSTCRTQNARTGMVRSSHPQFV